MKEIILLGALAVLYKIGGRLFDRLDHFFEGLLCDNGTKSERP